MYDDLLKLAKQSLSIVDTSTAKDEEILNSIKSAVQDLSSLGIRVKENHQQIYNAIVLFVKSQFSTVPVNEKKRALETYRIIAGELAYSNETRARETDKPNLLFDSNFYTFRNGKDYVEYNAVGYMDSNGEKFNNDDKSISEYLERKGSLNPRKNMIEQIFNIYEARRIEPELNKWYARNRNSDNTKIQHIVINDLNNKDGILLKTNFAYQNFNITDSTSKYSLSFKLRKRTGIDRVYVRLRMLSKGNKIIDFKDRSKVYHSRKNGIITLSESANDMFSANTGSNFPSTNSMIIFETANNKRIHIPAGTYTLKGNLWRNQNNVNIEPYFYDSEVDGNKINETIISDVRNTLFFKTFTFEQDVWFSHMEFSNLKTTETFSYTFENLRFEIGDTSNIPAVYQSAFKDFPKGTSVNEFTEYKFENMTLKEGINQIEIYAQNEAEAEITDIMLVKSPTAEPWSLASFN